MRTARTRLAPCLLAGALMLAGCGDGPQTAPPMDITIPWHAPIATCATPANLAAMAVQVFIGGYEDAPCTLHVDPGTLAASGVCQRVLAGVSRPVLVTYSLPSAASSAGLGLYVGRIDLREAVWTSAGELVDVPTGGWFSAWDQDALDGLPIPADGCARVDPDDSRAWARCLLASRLPLTLDCGDTGEPNLARACRGELSGCP